VTCNALGRRAFVTVRDPHATSGTCPIGPSARAHFGAGASCCEARLWQNAPHRETTHLEAMPSTLFLLLLVVLVVAVAVRLSAMRGPLGSAKRVDRWLRDQGWHVRRMERRWLTRGPFPDLPPAGVKHSGLLYYLEVAGPDDRRRTGWIALPPGWQWLPTDRWRLQWGEGEPASPSGLSTRSFLLLLLMALAAILLVVVTIARSHAGGR